MVSHLNNDATKSVVFRVLRSHGVESLTQAQRQLARLEGHAHQVDFLTFHPSGKWLASWSWDGAMCLWDPIRSMLWFGRMVTRSTPAVGFVDAIVKRPIYPVPSRQES